MQNRCKKGGKIWPGSFWVPNCAAAGIHRIDTKTVRIQVVQTVCSMEALTCFLKMRNRQNSVSIHFFSICKKSRLWRFLLIFWYGLAVVYICIYIYAHISFIDPKYGSRMSCKRIQKKTPNIFQPVQARSNQSVYCIATVSSIVFSCHILP